VASHQGAQVATSGRPPNKIAGHQHQEVAGHLSQIDSHLSSLVASHRRGDRHAKNRIKVTIRHNEDMFNEIRDLDSIKERMPDQTTERTPGIIGDRTPATSHDRMSHDDLKILYRSDDNIIMLFKQMIGRKWSAADDRTAAKFNGLDLRLIEIGMIQTVIQSRGRRINSFAYFVPKIQTVLESNFDQGNLNAYLRRRREQLAKWMKEREKQ
jgi:hypothetical protein